MTALFRAISSAGSEHLVYTEGVGGSNPSSPTDFQKLQSHQILEFFFGQLSSLLDFTFYEDQ